MKKLFFVAILCLTPIFTSHAANVDCDAWIVFDRSDKKTTAHETFETASPLMYKLFTEQGALGTWNNNENINGIKEGGKWTVNTTITTACDLPEDATDKEIALKNIELIIENELNKYKTAETQARMPSILHGNILPGPKKGVNGSDYVRNQFIPKFINGILIFVMSLSILMIIIGGLMFVFSSGDSDLTTKAKTTITWAIVGVILTILSYAIVRFIIGINFSL
jgi:hypothetical protein